MIVHVVDATYRTRFNSREYWVVAVVRIWQQSWVASHSRITAFKHQKKKIFCLKAVIIEYYFGHPRLQPYSVRFTHECVIVVGSSIYYDHVNYVRKSKITMY